MNKALGLIGIAKRGGKLGIGYEVSSIAVRDGKAKAICTASDASERTRDWASSLDIPHLPLPATKAELGALLGRASCGQLVIFDLGIAAAVAEKLSEDSSEYSAALEELQAQNARQIKRKQKKLSRKG